MIKNAIDKVCDDYIDILERVIRDNPVGNVRGVFKNKTGFLIDQETLTLIIEVSLTVRTLEYYFKKDKRFKRVLLKLKHHAKNEINTFIFDNFKKQNPLE